MPRKQMSTRRLSIRGPAEGYGWDENDKVKAIMESYKLAELVHGNMEGIQGYFDYLSAMEDYMILSGEDDPEKKKSEWNEECRKLHEWNRELQSRISKDLKEDGDVNMLFAAFGESLRLEAPWDFDQYCLYLELDRPPEDKFYQPRRKTFREAVKGLQMLEDDELDELFLSMPPRCGKSTLATFYLTWQIGKHPNRSCLYSSHSDTVTRTFYNGVLEIIKDPYTYHWEKVFPKSVIKKLNAADQTINLLRNTKYPSLTCRSIDGTLNGACDCDNILCGDDLCKGIEQALNKDVMIRLWQKTQNDFLSRKKEKAKKFWIGTRWSLIDPIGCEETLLREEPSYKDVRWKQIALAALNEKGESNFDWGGAIGFSTDYFEQVKAGYEKNNDVASWNAVYMQQPIEREGSLFESAEMRFYDGVLPMGRPDKAFTHIDPSWGGGDFTAAPVCLQYGDDIFVPDVVYTNSEKSESIPLLADMIQRWALRIIEVEANKMTESFATELSNELRRRKFSRTITTRPASNSKSKADRIQARAPEIRNNFVFLESSKRQKHYQMFMDNVFGFTILGKVKHDDAPDALAGCADMVFSRHDNYAHVFNRGRF